MAIGDHKGYLAMGTSPQGKFGASMGSGYIPAMRRMGMGKFGSSKPKPMVSKPKKVTSY